METITGASEKALNIELLKIFAQRCIESERFCGDLIKSDKLRK